MIVIIVAMALAIELGSERALRPAASAMALAAVIVALVLTIATTRALTRPLRQTVAAVAAFRRHEPVQFPANSGGEAGALAGAFEQMIGDIENRSAELAGYANREPLYVAAVHSSNLAFLTTDLDWVITGWNPGAERMFGYSAEEAIGQSMDMLVPPERNDETAMIREKFRNGERIDNLDTVRLAKGGRPIQVVIEVSPLRKVTNKLVGSSAIFRDVTEQRLAEELFKLAVEACPSGMMMIDRSGLIVMVNSEIERLFGYRREDLISRPIEMLVPPRMRAGHAKLRAAYTLEAKIRNLGKGRELVGLHRDRSEFPIEIELNPINIRDGLLILAVVVDISERKSNERLKDEFVSTVSHELRTPLTSITASLALLSAGGGGCLPDSAARLVSIAHNNGQRLVRLVNEILDIEKIESGKLSFHLEKVNARAVVEQTIETSRAYAEDLGVSMRLDPNSVASDVRADPDRLAQVVGNLLSNAVKFSPRGAEVIVGVDERHDSIRITIRDHGPGIPEDFRRRVFEKFAQADSTDTRQRGGTGLGLSIVHEIVRQLGGEVGFETEIGVGTLFYVELPRWHATDDELTMPQGFNVLLCEDDPDVSAWLSARLVNNGFRVDIAASASEALQRADGGSYAAVLVDLKLPDGDGISLIQQLRGRPAYADIAIVVVSGNPARGRKDARASTLDVLDWLDKPVDLERLLGALKRPRVRNGKERPRILHVDRDEAQRVAVCVAMRACAEVVSVGSLEEARNALVVKSFDLAVLDIALLAGDGPELLSELCGNDGRLVPTVLLSARSGDPAYIERVCRALEQSSNTPERLIDALNRRFVKTVPSGQGEAGGQVNKNLEVA